jgi:hypothetical protein
MTIAKTQEAELAETFWQPTTSSTSPSLPSKDIERLRSVPGDLWQRCVALQPSKSVVMLLRDGDKEIKFGLGAREIEEELRKDLAWLQDWKETCLVVQRNPELRAEVMRPDIPDAQAIERILRYEPMLQRELYRAMDQLERLQRRRLGELVPPPANTRLSLEA